MHRCLEIPEIRLIICDYTCIQDLANLASTSSLFYHFALNVFWAHPKSLEDVANSGFVNNPELFHRTSTCTNSEDYSLELSRPIEPHEWKRFIWISEGVRNLLVFGSPRDALLLPLLATNTHLLPTPLFPLLKSLKLYRNSLPYSQPCLKPLLGPNLVSIELYFADLGPEDFISFREIHFTCPYIRRFELLATASDSKFETDLLSHSVKYWKNLEHFSAPCLTAEAFAELSSLDHMKSLFLYSLYDGPIPIMDRSWQSLSEIALDLPYDKWMELLPTLEQSPLSKMNILFHDSPLPYQWASAISKIASSSYSTIIRSLVIKDSAGISNPNSSTRRVIHFQDISSLLKLTSIVTLDLSPTDHVQFTDGNLIKMAETWPNLTRLSIRNASPLKPIPQVTLDGLAMLVRLCPSIRWIQFSFDCRRVPLTDDKPGNGARNYSIQALSTHFCPLTSPARVAAFLSSLFPRLILLNAERMRTIDQDQWGLWNQVESIVSVVSQAREQEEKHWTGGLQRIREGR